MLSKRIFLLKTSVIMTIAFVMGAYASSTPFSQYGMIQNVQNYSNNPFYNPNAAAVTVPKIVYANGPALKAGDCERAVGALLENICAQRNNCYGTTLADVRPSIMIQLSNLPGYNYASSCGGYIDTIYENYMKQNQNVNSVNNSAFPVATNTKTTTKTNSNIPQWQADYNKRASELKELQAQNAVDYTVSDTEFPKTINDLSFQDSIALKKASYAPYQNAEVYKPMDIERTTPEEKRQKQLTECQKIYACINNFGILETQAENNFFTEQKNSTNANTLHTAKNNLANAIKNAILSACTCTEKINTKDTYRKLMNVKCDKKFTTQAQTTAQNYVNSL